MKPMMIALAALALSASTYSASQAQDTNAPPPGGGGGGRGGVREACAADFAKVCAGVDRPGMRQCIADKFDQMSDGCKAAITAMRAARQSGGGGAGGTGGATPPPAN